MTFFKNHLKWTLPVLLMVLITPFTPYLDQNIAAYFTPFSESPFLKWIYDYGTYLALITASLSLIGLIFSRRLRPVFLFLFLTFAIGAGLITNIILKDYWGRPRPKQVITYGGEQEFRPYYYPNFFNQPEPSRSFPCGHCSMGFYFLAFAVLGYRYKKPWLLYSGIALTVVLGGLLSYARMAQGGHFLSDVLMAALVMWLTAIALEKGILK